MQLHAIAETVIASAAHHLIICCDSLWKSLATGLMGSSGPFQCCRFGLQVLASEISVGYEEIVNTQVLGVQGHKISNLREVSNCMATTVVMVPICFHLNLAGVYKPPVLARQPAHTRCSSNSGHAKLKMAGTYFCPQHLTTMDSAAVRKSIQHSLLWIFFTGLWISAMA